ncbi:MAG TPA: HIT family protein [Syntrophobacteraceae bacterium]|nr:HIT family protein [Syntrophobacteraceae bacterium]
MADCIFCRIVAGQIPCAKLYEDEYVLGFLDINPINPGHSLVLPKRHYAVLTEVPDRELEACIGAAKRVARAVSRSVGSAGLNLLQNNGRAAGQLIEHVHFHLIPRDPGDGFLTSWPGKPYPSGQMEAVLEKIKAAL